MARKTSGKRIPIIALIAALAALAGSGTASAGIGKSAPATVVPAAPVASIGLTPDASWAEEASWAES
jgi:hypothetical protein